MKSILQKVAAEAQEAYQQAWDNYVNGQNSLVVAKIKEFIFYHAQDLCPKLDLSTLEITTDLIQKDIFNQEAFDWTFRIAIQTMGSRPTELIRVALRNNEVEITPEIGRQKLSPEPHGFDAALTAAGALLVVSGAPWFAGFIKETAEHIWGASEHDKGLASEAGKTSNQADQLLADYIKKQEDEHMQQLLSSKEPVIFPKVAKYKISRNEADGLTQPILDMQPGVLSLYTSKKDYYFAAGYRMTGISKSGKKASLIIFRGRDVSEQVEVKDVPVERVIEFLKAAQLFIESGAEALTKKETLKYNKALAEFNARQKELSVK